MAGSLDVGRICFLHFCFLFIVFRSILEAKLGPCWEVFVCVFSIQVAMPFCRISGIDFGDFLHKSKWPPYSKYQYFVALGYLSIDAFFMHFWADDDPIFRQKTHSEKRKCWCPFVFIFVAAHGSLYGAIFRPKLTHPRGLTAPRNLAGTQGWVKFSSRWAKMAHFGSSCPILKLKMSQDGLFLAPKIKGKSFFLSIL